MTQHGPAITDEQWSQIIRAVRDEDGPGFEISRKQMEIVLRAASTLDSPASTQQSSTTGNSLTRDQAEDAIAKRRHEAEHLAGFDDLTWDQLPEARKEMARGEACLDIDLIGDLVNVQPSGNSLSGEQGDREQLLKLRDAFLSGEAARAYFKAVNGITPEPNGVEIADVQFGLAAVWNVATGHEFSLSTQPNPEPHLSGDGERLEEIAAELSRLSPPHPRRRYELAASLRDLASRLSSDKDRCPTCLSSNPYWTQCIDGIQAEEETGRKPPKRSARGGCSDPWHEDRIARLSSEDRTDEPSQVDALSVADQSEDSSGVEKEQPTIKFTTVEVSTAKDFRHLEQWPAGFTLCGADMFPPADADGKPPRIGFSRGGGVSGKEPCPECVRRAQRFRSQRRITVTGLEAEAFHSAIPAEAPASTQPVSPQPDSTTRLSEGTGDYLVSVLHAINHSGEVLDAALKRLEQVTESEGRRRGIEHVLDTAVFVARTQQVEGAPSEAEWVRDRLDEHGQEPAPIGTREQIDKLTDECPDCHGEVCGGGGNSDEPAWSCSTCIGGRVPRLSKDGGEEGLRVDVLTQEECAALCYAAAERPREQDAAALDRAVEKLLPAATNQQPQEGEHG